MAKEIPTIEDLENLKQDLLQEIQKLIISNSKSSSKRWLRSKDVCKLLGISSSTLQNFRNKGVIPFKRLEGTLFYDPEQIENTIQDWKEEE